MPVTMVKGPATVTVKGECRVLGSDVSDRTVVVNDGKALPFESSGLCEVNAEIGHGGKIWQADPSVAGTSMWVGIARKALARNATIMLAGDTDTGKTTLSTYLANMALGLGMKPCIVDGDIGQGDLAPPTAIGAAAITHPVTDLRDVCAHLFEFVGNTSPAGFERIVAAKLTSITRKAKRLGDICIVNTDGYARNDGISYKVMIANKVQPDIIICTGDNPELVDALESTRRQVLRAQSSSQAAKSRSERIGHRLDQFLSYIGNKTVSIQLSQTRLVYRNRTFSAYHLHHPPIAQLEPGNIMDMFVGVGSRESVAGFGIVTGIVFGRMYVQTRIRSFSRIYLSNIRLSRDRTREIRIA